MSMYHPPKTKQSWFQIGHNKPAHGQAERWLVMFGRYSFQIIKRREGWDR